MVIYKFGVIDFEWVNRRNWSVCIKQPSYDVRTLLEMNLSSLIKLCITYNFKIPVLLFDKSPYLKKEVVTEYKSDRKYVSSKDLALHEPGSPEYKEIEDQLNKLEVLSDAKYRMIKEWQSFSLPLIMEGYEADDLAYYLTELITEKSLFYSKDSDFRFFSTNIHDVIISRKFGDELYTGRYPSKIPVIYNKVITELFLSSHNGVLISKGLNFDEVEIYQKYLSNELPEEDIRRINGMNPESYRNEKVINYLTSKIAIDGFDFPDVHYLTSFAKIKYRVPKFVDIIGSTFINEYLK